MPHSDATSGWAASLLPGWFDLLGLMGWPLAACALLVVAVSLERLAFYVNLQVRWRRHAAAAARQVEALKAYPKALRDDVASQVVIDIQAAYFKGIGLLRTVSVVSPLLGLLGTILGIISAFKVIAARTGPVSPNMIADGLWEAMLTTAVGLLIALPAILAAYVFRHWGERKLRTVCRELNRLSLAYEMEKQGPTS